MNIIIIIVILTNIILVITNSLCAKEVARHPDFDSEELDKPSDNGKLQLPLEPTLNSKVVLKRIAGLMGPPDI